jgi:chromosome segregation ATPase
MITRVLIDTLVSLRYTPNASMMSDLVQQAQAQQQQHQQQQQQYHDSMDDDDDDDDDHHDEIVNDDDRLPGETESEIKRRKRKERLEQNRISARESRKRKKTMIEELQRTVITLSRENKDLNERNEQLRRNLMEIGTKVCHAVRVAVNFACSTLLY